MAEGATVHGLRDDQDAWHRRHGVSPSVTMPLVPGQGPLRLLFLNQGNLKSGVLGHGRVEASIRGGLDGEPDVSARFVRLGPWGPGARALGGRWPVLHEAGVDFHVARWYLTDGMRGAIARRQAERREPADVVHVHSHSLAFAMRMSGRSPTVISADAGLRAWQALGTDIGAGPRLDAELELSLAMERRALRGSALTLAWTASVRRALEAECPEARFAVHHPGIDARMFSPPPGARPRSGRVLFVGGRFEVKGGALLIEALEHRLGKDVHLDVVTPGEAPERDGVHVHRLDPGAPELIELYRRADVFCLPSRRDAVPFAVIEAMACGAPVVATAVGSLPEMVGDTGAGMVVAPGDVRALREALEHLLDDDAARAQTSAAARAAVERDFDAARQTPRLVELLRQVGAGAL